jgi:hypothetical protein
MRKRSSRNSKNKRSPKSSSIGRKRRTYPTSSKPKGISYRQNSYRAVRRGGTVKRAPSSIKKRREPAVNRAGSMPGRLTLGQSLKIRATALKSATSQRLKHILKRCIDRPDPRAAGKERQRQRRVGGGSNANAAKKNWKPWC